MPGKNGEITICDVVDYETDIKPFPLIKIYSGVGSGKSYFASSMVTGSKQYKIPKHNVLLITSRRAKVNETLEELGIHAKDKIGKEGNLSFEIWQTGEIAPDVFEEYRRDITIDVPDFGELKYSTYNKSVVCTNAFISAYLRYVYDSKNPFTYIWNKYDAIIIDEVHSLVTDSTYQSATFDVLSLISEYLDLCKKGLLQHMVCKHLILMTGTPQPFEEHVDLDFPKNLTNTMELFDKCHNVVPEKVILIDKQAAKTKMKTLLADREKVIYFTNHILTESAARREFNLDNSINIGVAFSKEEKRKTLSKDELKKLTDIEKNLVEHNRLPEDFQLFVTTSRNKEGINIKNDDIKYMFVETHMMYDAVQMAGRVRYGVDTLYIITDAKPLTSKNDISDILFSKKIIVENDDKDSKDEANKYLVSEYTENESHLQKTKEEQKNSIRNYAKYIENKFPYVRYHNFKEKFEFFTIKEEAEKMTETQEQSFRNMLSSNNNEYVEHWFPHSLVSREISTKEHAMSYLMNLMAPNNFVRLSEDEFRKHMLAVKMILNSDLKYTLPLLHSIDELFNFTIQRDGYLLYYGEKAPSLKRKPMGKRTKR